MIEDNYMLYIYIVFFLSTRYAIVFIYYYRMCTLSATDLQRGEKNKNMADTRECVALDVPPIFFFSLPLAEAKEVKEPNKIKSYT
jgi:hypothetical protein